MKRTNWKKAFYILDEYFDSIPDEEKEEVWEKLKQCGVN